MNKSEEELLKKVEAMDKRIRVLERKVAVKIYSVTHRTVEPIRKNMLTTAEASSYLGMEPDSLRGLVFKKQIPYYKPNGKNLYFAQEDLDTWIRRNHCPAEND